MNADKPIRVKLVSRVFILLMRFVYLIQGSILKNYAAFSFIVGHAPQKLGAEACYYRGFKEFLIAFHRVPAYREFLRKRGWSCASTDPKEILRSLPLMDKPGYILAYSTEDSLNRGAANGLAGPLCRHVEVRTGTIDLGFDGVSPVGGWQKMGPQERRPTTFGSVAPCVKPL